MHDQGCDLGDECDFCYRPAVLCNGQIHICRVCMEEVATDPNINPTPEDAEDYRTGWDVIDA